MIIKEINIQNFKSYGNNKQTLKFDKDGQLILIVGDNGAGKSTLQETIDFSLFGIVRGKEKKKIPKLDLPNRINNSLLTSIKFINYNNDEIKIERGLKPLKFEIKKNSNDITIDYKNYDQINKYNLIGFNYDLYKAFISINLNDFTNFITLDPNTKRKLLNKLFNLEELDIYYEISKNIIRENEKTINNIENDINNNLKNIETYNKNIKNIDKLFVSKNEIKEKILDKKSKFLNLKENINDINKLIFDNKIDLNNKNQILLNKNEILKTTNLKLEHLNEKIKIYKNGNCPFCETNLKTNKQVNILNNFLKEKEELIIDKDKLNKETIDYKSDLKQLYLNKNNLFNDLKILKKEFDNIKYDLKLLKKDYDNFNKNNTAILEINKNIEKINKKNKDLNDLLINLKNKNINYEKLKNIFSINGIRKNIISNIIKPINIYLNENLNKLKCDFNVNINNEFNIDIYENSINKINPETLSTGESRKINMAIALSYLEIIRNIKKCNILFLDEIFASIDYENIDLLLKTLKEFTLKYNINILVISQDEKDFNLDFFDKIIKIEKKMFSFINEKNINNEK